MIELFDPNFVQGSLKLVFVIGALLYMIYTFIVFRQIQVMKNTLITSFSPMVSLLGLINLALAVALFVGFLLFL